MSSCGLLSFEVTPCSLLLALEWDRIWRAHATWWFRDSRGANPSETQSSALCLALNRHKESREKSRDKTMKPVKNKMHLFVSWIGSHCGPLGTKWGNYSAAPSLERGRCIYSRITLMRLRSRPASTLDLYRTARLFSCSLRVFSSSQRRRRSHSHVDGGRSSRVRQ